MSTIRPFPKFPEEKRNNFAGMFHTSKDYHLLYKLIRKGYRIPCWIKNENFANESFDLAEVKINTFSKSYMIGTRGIGYESYNKLEKDKFLSDCTHLQLEFILPNL